MRIKRICSHNAPLALLFTHGLTTTGLLNITMYPLHYGAQVFYLQRYARFVHARMKLKSGLYILRHAHFGAAHRFERIIVLYLNPKLWPLSWASSTYAVLILVQRI